MMKERGPTSRRETIEKSELRLFQYLQEKQVHSKTDKWYMIIEQ